MAKLTVRKSTLSIWYDVVLEAQDSSRILLPESAEYYLVSLLLRYTDQPDFVDNVLGKLYLESQGKRPAASRASLRDVGDQCLLFAGLFPEHAERRRVNPDYFSELGKVAYSQLADYDQKGFTGIFKELLTYFDSMIATLHTLKHLSETRDKEAHDIHTVWQNMRLISTRH